MKGAALYAYNDAVFTEDDWKGIRMLLQSVKQHDPNKVGYFGMGFKSVFHVTDLPSILSGDNLGILDPHQQFFDGSGSHAWTLSRDGPTLLASARHQLDPYLGLFGCNEDTFSSTCHYPGTVFRFPLRTTPSPLSDTVYTTSRIASLLSNFELDAELNLIFLRSVERIEVYERSRGSAEPVLRYRVQVSESCAKEVREHRRSFLSRTQLSRGKVLDRPVTISHQLTVDATRIIKSSSSSSQRQETTVSSMYLVTNHHCGGPLSAAFRKLQQDADLRLLPVVGTAMILDEARTSGFVGRMFSYLPLLRDGSSNTGLPIHVNGAFALEANRKHVKWPSMISSERSRDEHLDKHLLWNQCLLREALPTAYCSMLLAAVQLHASTADPPFAAKMIYHAFPDFSAVDRRWECVLPLVYTELFKQAVVYTEADCGIWVEPRHAIFNTLSESEPELANIILSVLAVAGVKVADCPSHVLRAINKCCRFTLNEITPVVVATAVRKVQYGGNSPLSWDSRLRLLRYFLQRAKYDLLEGLDLLPLANGGFTEVRFNPRKADRPVYTAPSVDVFKLLLVSGSCLEDEFLDMDIDKDVRKMLLDAAKKG